MHVHTVTNQFRLVTVPVDLPQHTISIASLSHATLRNGIHLISPTLLCLWMQVRYLISGPRFSRSFLPFLFPHNSVCRGINPTVTMGRGQPHGQGSWNLTRITNEGLMTREFLNRNAVTRSES